MAAAGICVAAPQSDGDADKPNAPAPAVRDVSPDLYKNSLPRRSTWIRGLRDDAVQFPGRLVEDQKQIWTSPLKIQLTDAQWLVPSVGITTAAFYTDTSFSKALPDSAVSTFKGVRLGSVAALGAVSGGIYLWGLHRHDPHQRETGLLASEAIIDSLLVTESIKLAVPRQR